MAILLIGYRGSGKTTVGRLLSRIRNEPFADADDLIIQRAGKSIREIFQAGGEPAFRKIEAEVIADLAGSASGVIGLGGGAILSEGNRTALSGHKIVYLHCEPAELLRRITTDPATSDNRPNLTSLGGGIEEIQTLLEQREPIYRAAMTHEIDVTNLTPQQVADRLAKL
jgi:shikimate kinase